MTGATLHGAHRIEHSEEQGAFAVPGDLHRFLTPQTTASGEVVDLTGKMSDDRTLETVSRYYSGTGIYTAKFNFKSTQGSATATIIIDLGEVKEMAEVVVNGISAGVLWRAPFRTGDISHLLREGEKILTVKVTNIWVNRMIGDKQPDTKEKVTRVTRFYEADDPLPSGLLGPVRIIIGI